ncbi:serine hydrolase [Dyadobacter sp. CY356]|uniref:serine hydrolase domain-containing protein n=1 Tax=Dyadobacter sp. CY356 TaxID=2906442 RepID=UPI001F46F6F0|nr:serine hydrolase domain-containing protein [Dyadobacter sp. CY356]MCF0055445.1 beta-lactamase family protein [Dyadobacter sp. CY356]
MIDLRKLVFHLAVAAFVVTEPICTYAQPRGSASETPENKYVLNYLQRVVDESGAPGVSASVAVNGKMIFSGGVGYADLDNKVLQTGKTVHNIGSVSKAVAVIAIMQLEEKGLLSLDDEIQKFLPYFPKKQKPITVKHILTHTSGIRHYAAKDNDNFGLSHMRHYDDFQEATAIFRDDSLLFTPGAYFSYSSYASNLMHGIVEKITGISFEEYMKRNIWQPAGMLATWFDIPSRVIPNRGKGYVRDKSGVIVNPDYEDTSYKYAGGGIIASSEDMVKLAIGLNDGILLRPATLAKMYTPYFEKNEKSLHPSKSAGIIPTWQGLIWFVGKDQAGRNWYGHSGTVKGTRCFLLNYPAEGLVVAIQANIGSVKIDEYAQLLAQMYLKEEVKMDKKK